MPNILTRAVAVVRGNPALAVAVGGVGLAAAVSVGRRRSEGEAPPTASAVDNSAASPIGGYGAGLTQPLPGPDFGYSNESASQVAALLNAITTGNDAVRKAIEAQAARTVTLPAPPAKQVPASLPADLGTIVIGLRKQYPTHYTAWLKYAGAAGTQKPGESATARTARLRRELAFYTARIGK